MVLFDRRPRSQHQSHFHHYHHLCHHCHQMISLSSKRTGVFSSITEDNHLLRWEAEICVLSRCWKFCESKALKLFSFLNCQLKQSSGSRKNSTEKDPIEGRHTRLLRALQHTLPMSSRQLYENIHSRLHQRMENRRWKRSETQIYHAEPHKFWQWERKTIVKNCIAIHVYRE